MGEGEGEGIGMEDPKVKAAWEWLSSAKAIIPYSGEKLGIGFYDAFIVQGVVVEHVEPSRIVCSLRVPPRLCNSANFMHGGATAALVDIVGTAALLTTDIANSGVSVEINVSYMSAAHLDEVIEMESNVLRVGKNLAVVSVDFRKKATGEMIAQGRHTKYLVRPKKTPTSKL